MTNSELISLFYRVFLGREPDGPGLDHHVALVDNNSGDLRPAIASILGSPEYIDTHRQPVPLDLSQSLKRPIAIVDVGAQELSNEPHVYEPLIRSGLPWSCIAFEPLDERRAERERKDAGSPLRLLPFFIGDGSRQTFHINNDDATSSLLPLNDSVNVPLSFLRELRTIKTVDVQTRALDDVLSDVAYVDLLKLDIQGFELAALRGAESLLGRTNVVHVEVEFVPMYVGAPPFGEIDTYLRKQRFEFIDLVTAMRHRYVDVPAPSERQERLCWGDAVYFRDLPIDESSKPHAIAQAIIASHIYAKNGLAQHILQRHGCAS